MTKQKAVFFDRDGVVNVDTEYIYRIEDFVYVEGFLDLFRHCKEKGYMLFCATNQSGIGRGYYTLGDFLKLSDFMQRDLAEKCGFNFTKIYYCAHRPDENCSCRKPKPGMILQAAAEFPINLAESFFIGDKNSDIMAGINAGIGTTILFTPRTDSRTKASFIVDSLHKVHSIIR